MKRLLIFLISGLFFNTPIYIYGQSLVAGRICNSAASQTSGSGKTIISTFGGCPNCGELSGDSGSISAGIPVDDGNCFSVAFDFDSQTDDCGSIYDFFYTGNADLPLVSFEWNFGANAVPSTSNEVSPMGVVYTSTGTQDISLRIFNDDCDITVNGTIMVNNIGFTAAVNSSNITCEGANDGAIEIEIVGGNQPIIIEWSTGDTETAIANLSVGDYAYTLTDATDCETINSVSISEPTALNISIEKIDETCQDAQDGSISLTIEGGSTPYSINWQDGSDELTRNGLTGGNYEVSMVDANDCEKVENIFIDQTCDPKMFDTISPNGDDINDMWRIKGIENFPENEVRIYNRWGDLVFQQDAYVNDWAGTNTAGEALPAGAYYYVVNYNDEANTVLTGSITIVR